ncbi:hypothetical protein J4444_03770 [Candidatus Woesearchaeota archaeon]|nr:hypothetical protein [Candidatus Woesearchaeota archaeon]
MINLSFTKYLKTGLTRTFKAIKEHWLLAILLVFLQLILIFGSGAVIFYYQIQLINDAQGIINPLQNANYDSNALESGQPFSEDLISVYTSYQSLIRNLIIFLLILTAIFIFVQGAIWVVSSFMLMDKNKEKDDNNHKHENKNIHFYHKFYTACKPIFSLWLKFVASSLAVLIPFALISYYILKTLIGLEYSVDTVSYYAQIIVYIFAAIYYLLLVAYAFISVDSWKQFIHYFYIAGLKRIYKAIIVFTINFLTIGLGFYLIYVLIDYDQYFSYMILVSILLYLVIIMSRLFWIACLQEIVHEEDYN